MKFFNTEIILILQVILVPVTVAKGLKFRLIIKTKNNQPLYVPICNNVIAL